jgi:hypothetical protein
LQRQQQATLAAQAERDLRVKKENALRDSRDQLSQAREQHAAAMAEIERLKAMLEQQQPAPATSARSAGTRVAMAAPPSSAKGVATDATISGHKVSIASELPADDDLQSELSYLGNKQQYLALLTAAGQQQGARARSKKVMHIKTYKDDRLSKQTSHSLRHLGNGLYQGRTVVRSGTTSFVIAGKHWRAEIPHSDHKQQYIFILDTRDNSNPELTMFDRSEVQ